LGSTYPQLPHKDESFLEYIYAQVDIRIRDCFYNKIYTYPMKSKTLIITIIF